MKIKVFTKRDLHKEFVVYWCGHWNTIKVKDFSEDMQQVEVYNYNLNSRTYVPNYFEVKGE